MTFLVVIFVMMQYPLKFCLLPLGPKTENELVLIFFFFFFFCHHEMGSLYSEAEYMRIKNLFN